MISKNLFIFLTIFSSFNFKPPASEKNPCSHFYLITNFNISTNLISDALGEIDPNATESVRGDEEEDVVEEQKEEGKLGFCEIQWQQKTNHAPVGKKFSKKNSKRLDDTTKKLNLTITKIEEERDEDKIQIIQLTSPIKVRSPLGYRSSYNLSVDAPVCSTSNDLNVTTLKTPPVYLPSANIKSAPQPRASNAHLVDASSFRKSSLMSLRSLSLSLRIFKNRGRMSEGYIEPCGLKPIGEREHRSSIFKMDIFEKNLKKFVSRSNEPEFQTYSEYTEQHHPPKKTSRVGIFKAQKVFARRSSMSDIPDANINHRPPQLQPASSASHMPSNVKHETHKKDKKQDKTAEMLKEVRKRNLESAKRNNAPRRISTAY